MLRHTLLLTNELTLYLYAMISFSKNCYRDSLKYYSTALDTILKQSLGPQLKCRFTIYDSMSCAKKRPYMVIIDLSFVSAVIEKLCLSIPLGQVTNLQSMPTRQFPFSLTVCYGSMVSKKVYSSSPYSLSPTVLKENPKKRKRMVTTPPTITKTSNSFHRSFIQTQLYTLTIRLQFI